MDTKLREHKATLIYGDGGKPLHNLWQVNVSVRGAEVDISFLWGEYVIHSTASGFLAVVHRSNSELIELGTYPTLSDAQDAVCKYGMADNSTRVGVFTHDRTFYWIAGHRASCKRNAENILKLFKGRKIKTEDGVDIDHSDIKTMILEPLKRAA